MANVRYAIRDLAVVADEVAREGHKILYLNIGDPCKFDFPTPPHMIEAVHKAMLDGHNSYGESLGIKPAVDAIRHQAEANGFKDIQSIFVGYGSGEVIDSCLTALLNPGDNVLTPSPEYPLYGAVLAKLDAVPNAYDLDESNGWEPDVADIERQDQSAHAGDPADQSEQSDGRGDVAANPGEGAGAGARGTTWSSSPTRFTTS